MKLLLSVILVFWSSPAHALWAQLDLLTPGEVSSIVQHIPPVVDAGRKLSCPVRIDAVVDALGPFTMNVEVRARCGHSTSSLIDRYVVDRRTGSVETWGDSPSNVGDRSSEAFAAELVRRARARRLSPQESQCLALEAGRSLTGWNGPSASIDIQPFASSGSPETLFWLSRKSLGPATEVRVPLYVNPGTGVVLNESTASEVTSAGPGELLGKFIALRSPPLLSDQDALSIALRIPAFAALSQRLGCSLIAGSAFASEEVPITPACDGHYLLDGPRVAINLRNGVVSDADTGKEIDTPEASLLAGTLVSAIRDARLRLQGEVNAKCGLEPR